ncbi:hypothetical protein, partial [Actinophytocola sp.]|uniref:hypothetical protein n=1 Tax=Actinophytocola sp. TaxID=1872138 RepID=UPI003899B2A4
MTMAALLPDPPPVAFRYALPSEPVAEAAVAIGNVAVTIGLLLTGELDVLTEPGAASASVVTP